jgi:thiol-disulfide isomerase/thioredoxin
MRFPTVLKSCLGLLGLLLLTTPGMAEPPVGAPQPREAVLKAPLRVGSDSLPFTLPDLDGKDVSLSQHLGQRAVLLVFWSLFCGPCREELPLLDQIAKKFEGQGLEVLAINLDGPRMDSAVRRYATSGGFALRSCGRRSRARST